MKPKLLIRIAACLILLQLLGHTYGHVIWDKRPNDPKMQEVLDTMKSYSGNFMGATKSMADYYSGYSLMIFFLYVMTIAILWLLSGANSRETGIVPKLLYLIGGTYLVLSVILYLHFFLLPACLSFLAATLLLVSTRGINKST
jgi:hypothetical protein